MYSLSGHIFLISVFENSDHHKHTYAPLLDHTLHYRPSVYMNLRVRVLFNRMN